LYRCRKALNLIQYLLHNNKADKSFATELGLPKLMMHLAASDDPLVREAALSGLLELSQDQTSGNALPDQDKLKRDPEEPNRRDQCDGL
jgi:hsp70-interacting protein